MNEGASQIAREEIEDLLLAAMAEECGKASDDDASDLSDPPGQQASGGIVPHRPNSESPGEALESLLVARAAMTLLLTLHLDPILQAAKEVVGVEQPGSDLLG
jgi:hypothetical protein